MSLSLHVPGCKLHASAFTLQWQYKVALNQVGMRPHYCPKAIYGPSYQKARHWKRTGSYSLALWVFFLSRKAAVESAVPFDLLSALVGTQGKLCSSTFPPCSDPSWHAGHLRRGTDGSPANELIHSLPSLCFSQHQPHIFIFRGDLRRHIHPLS